MATAQRDRRSATDGARPPLRHTRRASQPATAPRRGYAAVAGVSSRTKSVEQTAPPAGVGAAPTGWPAPPVHRGWCATAPCRTTAAEIRQPACRRRGRQRVGVDPRDGRIEIGIAVVHAVVAAAGEAAEFVRRAPGRQRGGVADVGDEEELRRRCRPPRIKARPDGALHGAVAQRGRQVHAGALAERQGAAAAPGRAGRSARRESGRGCRPRDKRRAARQFARAAAHHAVGQAQVQAGSHRREPAAAGQRMPRPSSCRGARVFRQLERQQAAERPAEGHDLARYP